MRNLFILGLIGLAVIISGLAFAQEESITITTYYPAPYGVYREMRAKRMAIGDTYYDSSEYCWEGFCTTAIDPDADLIVEGNVGIGTAEPGAKLHVGGTPGTDGIMFPDGTLQTTAGGSTIILHAAADAWTCSINLPDGTWLLQVHAAFQQHTQTAAYLKVDGITIETTSNVGDPPGVEQITMFGVKAVSGGSHTATIQAGNIWSNGSPRIMIIAFKTAS